MNANELSYTTLSLIKSIATREGASVNCGLSQGAASAAAADLTRITNEGSQVCQVTVCGENNLNTYVSVLQAINACATDVSSVMAQSLDQDIIMASGSASKNDGKLLWQVQATGQEASLKVMIKDKATGKISMVTYEGDKLGTADDLVSIDVVRCAIRLQQVAKRSIQNNGQVVENLRLIPS